MSLLLGVDLGTSYFKVGLFETTGALRGLGRVAVPIGSSRSGGAELPVATFWNLLRSALAEARRSAGDGEIAGISYSSQANTFLLLDRADEPITPLVMWTDLRADPLDAGLADFAQRPEFFAHTGLGGISSRSAAVKAWWMRKNDPGRWQRARRLMTLSDYFTFALTGERVGDAGTAALLGLRDLTRDEWWPESLRKFEIPREMLSTVHRPGTVAGRTTARGGRGLGLPAGIPFAVGSLDHHVAALGAGVGTAADLSISTGTVLAALAIVGAINPQAGCFHGPDFTVGKFFRLAFDSLGAGQLEEYQRLHAPRESLADLIASAARILPGHPVERRPRPDAPGIEHAASVRYLLEKIAFAQRTLVQRAANEGSLKTLVATGGGSQSDVWLQIQADMIGVPVLVPASPESACLGAAMLAGVAAGIHARPTSAAEAMRQPHRYFRPDSHRSAMYLHWRSEVGSEH